MTNKIDVFYVTGCIIRKIDREREFSSGKAILANLRNSIGRSLSDTVDVWPIVFEFIPEHFLSDRGNLTAEEKAILYTLQLYAVHQQGLDHSVNDFENNYKKIGQSLARLRTVDDSRAVDRRFNALITSTDFDELINHLRQMVKLLKSNYKDVKINYPALARDLYWFQRGYDEKVRLTWGKSYYRGKRQNEEEQVNE